VRVREGELSLSAIFQSSIFLFRRPILFRGSTVQLVETFKKTAHPHGSVASSDVYALGLIKSKTDFEVYVEAGGMKGLDVAFYVNRDKYHTMADTVASLNGKQSLWCELQLVTDVGRALANLDIKDDSEKAVYWDSKIDSSSSYKLR
jgi:hypothetical protein